MKINLQRLIAVSAFLLTGFFSSQASHYSAGEVFYKWIGNEPGKNQFDYRVYATIYRNVGGVQIGTGNLNGCAYRVSGGPNITFTLSYLSPNISLPPNATLTATNPHGWLPTNVHPNDPNGWDIPEFEGCADSPKDISEYRYVGEIRLTGLHPDWRFAIIPPCCRDQNDNLAGAGGLYIEVDLNNQIGPNSSPRIITPAAKTFCVVQPGQKPFEWFQTAAEIDGDSLTYGFYAAGSQSGSCGNPQPINYSGNYTAQVPIPIQTNTTISINQRLGIFTFSPGAAGSFVVKIEVQERRFDTITLTWQYIGNTVRELQIPIAPACRAAAEDGPKLDISSPSISTLIYNSTQIDSLKAAYSQYVLTPADSTQVGANYRDFQIPLYSGYNCFDDRLTLNFDIKVKCSTATPTDFRLIGPDGVARPVVDIDTKCAVDGVTQEIDLILHQALDADGLYLLQIRRGNDGNTLENECGYELNANYTALVEVNNCPKPTYQLDGVSVVDDRWVRLNWSGNADLSDTNIANTFNEWLILRADAGERPYSIVGRGQDPTSRSYLDNSFGNNGYFVDNIKYDYALLLVYNGKGREYTRFCNNIVLQQDTDRTSLTNVGLFWTPYNCIDEADLQYNVYRGRVDTATGAIAEEFIATTTDTTYNLSRPEPDSLNDGFYAINVVARNPNGNSITDSSLSNWIYYKLTYYPPPPPPEDPAPVVVPNVITPNGDLQNDRFYVKPLLDGQQFEKISFTLYNRWGNKVFEDGSFHNRNTQQTGWDGTGSDGNPLAEGVYFYILKLDDPATGISETKKGNLTLLRGGL
jgi:gliding motility-associated-like protein